MRMETVALGVCALTLGLGGNAWAVAPNYIVIVADDLGSDKLSQFVGDGGTTVTNFPSTPKLNALGTAGLRFINAWANPTCSPTRASLHTGNYAWRSNIGTHLPPNAPNELGDVATLPGVLHD